MSPTRQWRSTALRTAYPIRSQSTIGSSMPWRSISRRIAAPIALSSAFICASLRPSEFDKVGSVWGEGEFCRPIGGAAEDWKELSVE